MVCINPQPKNTLLKKQENTTASYKMISVVVDWIWLPGEAGSYCAGAIQEIGSRFLQAPIVEKDWILIPQTRLGVHQVFKIAILQVAI